MRARWISNVCMSAPIKVNAGGDVAIFYFRETDVQVFFYKDNTKINSVKTNFRKKRDLEEDDEGHQGPNHTHWASGAQRVLQCVERRLQNQRWVRLLRSIYVTFPRRVFMMVWVHSATHISQLPQCPSSGSTLHLQSFRVRPTRFPNSTMAHTRPTSSSKTSSE